MGDTVRDHDNSYRGDICLTVIIEDRRKHEMDLHLFDENNLLSDSLHSS